MNLGRLETYSCLAVFALFALPLLGGCKCDKQEVYVDAVVVGYCDNPSYSIDNTIFELTDGTRIDLYMTTKNDEGKWTTHDIGTQIVIKTTVQKIQDARLAQLTADLHPEIFNNPVVQQALQVLEVSRQNGIMEANEAYDKAVEDIRSAQTEYYKIIGASQQLHQTYEERAASEIEGEG